MAACGLNERRELAAVAEQLARGAGRILNSWWERLAKADVAVKSAERDLVTSADLASEAFLLEGIRREFPGDAVLAEESGAAGAADAAGIWYLDPLDGTVNFVHRLPMVAVSMARVVRGRPQVAVVHLPRLGETFVAVEGGGATLDGRPLRVSTTSAPRDALFATGFPYRRHFLRDNNLENFQRMFLQQRGIRRMGSAASDLAYVAAGRLDAFWELHLSPWDVAAGGLLVTEAGGLVDTIVPGGDWLHGGNLLAGPPVLAEALRAILREGRDSSYPDLGERTP